MREAAYEVNGRRASREAFYAIACDPRRSVAVEACAGAGKTWMLVSRMLRALLEGAAPHEILAITFTRKAAGQMRQRLQEWLAAFSRRDPDALAQELEARGVPREDAAALAPALKGLHGRVLAAGRSVQVRTFHSWFAALLRSAPLSVLEELGLPARHELLEDDSRAIALVWRRFHAAVWRDASARADYEALVAAHGRWQAQKALRTALDKRIEFARADAMGVVERSVRHWHDCFPQGRDLEEPCLALASAAARERWLARARALGAEENKTPRAAADAVVAAFECDDLRQRLELLRRGFLVASEPRLSQRLARYPHAQEAEAELQWLLAACAQHEAWLHQQRMARLTRILLREYAALKHEEGWVDMADVEQAAHRLLADHELSGWVQERLDARVSHLLVDEFQDTNPLQWQALHAWLSGYAGAGGRAPSVFIVGDPKQSIYRFRRAEPQVFAAAQAFVRDALQGDLLSCDHTHRCAPDVVAGINAVMEQAQRAQEYGGFRAHTTESDEAGELLRLPPVARPESEGADEAEDLAWRDSLSEPRTTMEERLVALECRQAARWVAARIAAGTPPGHIMVLARKRDRLALMEDELRRLHVPAQQPEKSHLGDSIEVQDVVALLDVLVSPGHDLSLARALKSPLFGLPDEALVELALRARQVAAEGAPRPWLELLQGGQDLPAGLQEAGAKLARWKAWVDRWPPHDALQAIYDDGDVLARYAAAVPPALREMALAHLRALPGAALELDGGRYATPYAFVRALKAGRLAAPAVATPNAVRLLTVHGAKGLEAAVVLILDTDAAAARAESMGVLVDWPGEQEAPRRFTFMTSEARPPVCNVEALQAELAARAREELNALYVAMTRAERILAVSSVQPRQPAAGSWWERLAPHCREEPVPEDVALPAAARAQRIELPAVPRLPVPVATTERAAAPTLDSRFGQCVHRLLELQWARREPAPARLQRLAREYGLDAEHLQQAVDMARRIATGEGAWAWDERQVAWSADEVELAHEGELLRLDRLVRRRDGEWWVLDYKSAARPQQQPALAAQLRRYGRAVTALHPGAPVRLAFLTGQGRMVEVAAGE